MDTTDVDGRLPNFLIVGAAKSGTTALAAFLSQNPDIFMSQPKEPRFLVADKWLALDPDRPAWEPSTRDLVTDLETYRGLFRDAGDHSLRGEASVSYLLYHDAAIPRIRALLGDVPIVIIVRKPVDLAISAYRHMRSRGWECEPLEVALEQEPQRRAAGWGPGFHYSALAAYGVGIDAFRHAFSQVHVLLHEDLEAAPEATVVPLCDVLGADVHPFNATVRHNQSKMAAEPRAHHRLLRRTTSKVPREWIPDRVRALGRRLADPGEVDIEVSHAVRARLIAEHTDDVDVVERITRRDLSHWRE